MTDTTKHNPIDTKPLANQQKVTESDPKPKALDHPVVSKSDASAANAQLKSTDSPLATSTEPVIEQLDPVTIEHKVVLFQYDPETTVEAIVLRENNSGTLDLQATVSQGKFTTKVSNGPTDQIFLNVRKGSFREVGTWFDPLPTI